MGILKHLRKSKKQKRTEEQSHDKNDEQQQNDESSGTYSRSNPSFRRRLSTGSMKKLRRMGACLRFIGDDLERRSQSGSLQDLSHQDKNVTEKVLKTANGEEKCNEVEQKKENEEVFEKTETVTIVDETKTETLEKKTETIDETKKETDETAQKEPAEVEEINNNAVENEDLSELKTVKEIATTGKKTKRYSTEI